MPIISLTAKKDIQKLIDALVVKYIAKIKKDGHLKNSGNPFVIALLSDFEPIMHSIHGLKTSLGNEMEKIAEIIAIDRWGKENVHRKIKRDVVLHRSVYATIDSILNRLSNAKTLSDYFVEKEEVRISVEKSKNSKEIEETHKYEFDLEIYDEDNDHYYFMEMKGPDPNTTEVPGAKRRLLTQLAWGYRYKKSKDVDCPIAVYYNNKYPLPYKNPKVLGYFNPTGGILLHDKFWNFIGKDDRTYSELLEIFKDYGKTNKRKIWNSFSKLIK